MAFSSTMIFRAIPFHRPRRISGSEGGTLNGRSPIASPDRPGYGARNDRIVPLSIRHRKRRPLGAAPSVRGDDFGARLKHAGTFDSFRWAPLDSRTWSFTRMVA